MSRHPNRAVLMTGLALGLAMALAACSDSEPADTAASSAPTEPPVTTAPADPVTVTLLTHDSFALSEGTLASFTDATGIEIELLQAGDAGTVVNQAILTKDNPTADLLYGIDNTFLSRALDEDLFVAYEAAGLADVPDELELDPEHRVTPISFGDVCLNYDKAAFAASGLPVPGSLRELTDAQYAGLLVVEDPATSSPGLAFLAATVSTFPEGSEYSWQMFWSDLAANDVRIDSDWETAYYGSFSGSAGDGDRPIVVSYASSPPAEVLFSDPPVDDAPTGVITDGCFRQIEFAGILAGTDHEDEAAQVIDFMLGLEFQQDVPLNMFVFPASTAAQLPPVFLEHTELPDEPVIGDAAAIEANREDWIDTWTDLVR